VFAEPTLSSSLLQGLTGQSINTGTALCVLLSDTADACADVRAPNLNPNAKYFFVLLADVNSSRNLVPAVAGTYGVHPQPTPLAASEIGYAGAVLNAFPNSTSEYKVGASSGTVTLTVAGQAASGSVSKANFSLAMEPNQEVASGNFSATYCADLAPFVQNQ